MSPTPFNSHVLDVFLVANTPIYLYRHLRREPSVVAASESASTESLLKTIQEVAVQSSPSSEDLASAYAAVVALTYKPTVNWDSILTATSQSSITWTQDILAFHRAREKPTQTMVITGATALPSHEHPQSAATTFAYISPAAR